MQRLAALCTAAGLAGAARTPGKNFAESGSTGPYLITAGAIRDPQSLDIQFRLIGEVPCCELPMYNVIKGTGADP